MSVLSCLYSCLSPLMTWSVIVNISLDLLFLFCDGVPGSGDFVSKPRIWGAGLTQRSRLDCGARTSPFTRHASRFSRASPNLGTTGTMESDGTSPSRSTSLEWPNESPRMGLPFSEAFTV